MRVTVVVADQTLARLVCVLIQFKISTEAHRRASPVDKSNQAFRLLFPTQ